MKTITLGQFLEEQKAPSAEEQAAKLSHWQILDMVFIHREGRMQITGTPPWRPVNQLIDLGILKKSAVVAHSPYLVPGHKFRPVLECLWRSGRVARPAEVVS